MLKLTKAIHMYEEGDDFTTPYISGFQIVDEMLSDDVYENPEDYPSDIVEHYTGTTEINEKDLYEFMESLITYYRS